MPLAELIFEEGDVSISLSLLLFKFFSEGEPSLAFFGESKPKVENLQTEIDLMLMSYLPEEFFVGEGEGVL